MSIISGNLALILTGVTTSVIGGFFFKEGHNAVIAGGSFQSKEKFIGLLIAQVFIIGLLTSPIHSFYSSFVGSFSYTLAVGLIILISNFYINESVTHWKHTSPKTLVIYLIAIAAIISGL